MRDEGLIPSNYHRRLVLAAIQKMIQDRPESAAVLMELWGNLLQRHFSAAELVAELAAVHPYEFDRWDSALSALAFPGFVELVE
jgi:hypothetical protein